MVATIIGGGMFALPVAFVNVWFIKGLLVLSVTGILMLITGLILVDITMRFPPWRQLSYLHPCPARTRCQRNHRRGFLFRTLFTDLRVHIRRSIDSVGSPSSRYCWPQLAADHFAVADDLADSVGRRQIARFSPLRPYRRQIHLFSPAVRRCRRRRKSTQDYSTSPAARRSSITFRSYRSALSLLDFMAASLSLTRMYRGDNHRAVLRSLYYGFAVSLTVYAFWLTLTMGRAHASGYPACQR